MNSLLKMLPMMIQLTRDNEDVREQAAFVAWRIAAGEQIAEDCVPFRLYSKQLVVAVPDQFWKKQLEQLSGEYLFRVNSLLAGSYVTFIEFRVDPEFVLQSHPEDQKPFEFHHTDELEAELKESAQCIKDPELREKFLRAAAKCLERRGA